METADVRSLNDLSWDKLEALQGGMPAPVLLSAPAGRARTLALARLSSQVADDGGRILWVGSQMMARPLAWMPLAELRLDARTARPPFGPGAWPAIGREDEMGDGAREVLRSTRDFDLIVVSGHPSDLSERYSEVVSLLGLFVEEAMSDPERPSLVVLEDPSWIHGGPGSNRVVELLVDLATIVPRSLICASALEVPSPIPDISTHLYASSSDIREAGLDDSYSELLRMERRGENSASPLVVARSSTGKSQGLLSPSPIDSDGGLRLLVM